MPLSNDLETKATQLREELRFVTHIIDCPHGNTSDNLSRLKELTTELAAIGELRVHSGPGAELG